MITTLQLDGPPDRQRQTVTLIAPEPRLVVSVPTSKRLVLTGPDSQTRLEAAPRLLTLELDA